MSKRCEHCRFDPPGSNPLFPELCDDCAEDAEEKMGEDFDRGWDDE